MRIIAGEYKGRRLNAPTDNSVRPTTDKVKEAVFSMLAYDIEDAVVVDLFAGTGNLGLEALSRGAERAYFGDSLRSSVALIRENIRLCGAENRAVLLAGDYLSVISRIREQADIIFLDPPYSRGLMEDCMKKIDEAGLLSPDGLIIAEHDKREELPLELAGMTRIKYKTYGRIAVSVYSYEN